MSTTKNDSQNSSAVSDLSMGFSNFFPYFSKQDLAKLFADLPDNFHSNKIILIISFYQYVN